MKKFYNPKVPYLLFVSKIFRYKSKFDITVATLGKSDQNRTTSSANAIRRDTIAPISFATFAVDVIILVRIIFTNIKGFFAGRFLVMVLNSFI